MVLKEFGDDNGVHIVVEKLAPGGIAATAGLAVGDIITSVNRESTHNFTLTELVQSLIIGQRREYDLELEIARPLLEGTRWEQKEAEKIKTETVSAARKTHRYGGVTEQKGHIVSAWYGNRNRTIGLAALGKGLARLQSFGGNAKTAGPSVLDVGAGACGLMLALSASDMHFTLLPLLPPCFRHPFLPSSPHPLLLPPPLQHLCPSSNTSAPLLQHFCPPDITAKVRSLVVGTTLDISVDTTTLGDPAPNKTKMLEVAYMHQGEEKTVSVCGDNGFRMEINDMDPMPEQQPGHVVRAWYGQRKSVLGTD
jgi:hypothetical protein